MKTVTSTKSPPIAGQPTGRTHQCIAGAGIDVFATERMARRIADDGSEFTSQVFTPAEIAACATSRTPAQAFALRFAAKEAVVKALAACGIVPFPWLEIETETSNGRPPRAVLHGRVRAAAERLGVTAVHVAFSHAKGMTVAAAVAERAVAGGGRRDECNDHTS